MQAYMKEYIFDGYLTYARYDDCWRANNIIIYEYTRMYFEVTPPQRMARGGGALEIQWYRNVRGALRRAGIAAD